MPEIGVVDAEAQQDSKPDDEREAHDAGWISRVPRRELEELAEGRRTSVTAVAYGSADGMRSSECNGNSQPAGWKARDGSLWFPTTRGAVRIVPEDDVARQAAALGLDRQAWLVAYCT